MKILLLTTHINIGGITSYLLTLTKGLTAKGHQVVVASSGGNMLKEFERAGARHLMVDVRTKSEIHPKLWWASSLISGFILEEGIEVIHAHTRVTQVMGHFLSGQTGVPMVTTCHGFFKRRWFRKVFPCWGKGVIAISCPVALHLWKDFGVANERIHMVTNGIDLKRFTVADQGERNKKRLELGIGDHPVIGIIARLSDVKGIDVLLKAMPVVIQAIPNIQLIIAGEGPEKEKLQQIVQDLSLHAFVRFESTVNHTRDLLAAFDVFVMPSLMEGLGLSVIEAQATGIPVIASNVGGLPELVEDSKTGYLVPVGDSQVLAQRIIEMLKNPVQAKAMAAEARFLVEQKFSSEKMVEGTLKVYEQYLRR